MAAVYGPRPAERRAGFSDRGRLRVSAHALPFAASGGFAGGDARRRERQQGARLAATRLHDALEAAVRGGAFPKAAVDVRVSVLEADGGEEAAAVVAASLALADAGVEAVDLAAACGVALVRGKLVLDPTAAEAAVADASLVCACLPATGGVTQLSVRGAFRSDAEQREAVELALGGCSRLRDGMRQVLLSSAAAAAVAVGGGAAAAAGAAG
jgi:ribonuclease PH